MTRTDIIQFLVNKIGAKDYLEIGMGAGLNFKTINCENKTSVDPTPTVSVTHSITSDDFFKQNDKSFDIIFIDGLHWSEQVYKDIINSLNILNEDGYIICHDMNPHTEFMQRYPQPKAECEWTGDCWKAWVKLKTEYDDLEMNVVDTDYGCGIISKGIQKLIKHDYELTWESLEKNRKELLNLISIEEFKEIYL